MHDDYEVHCGLDPTPLPQKRFDVRDSPVERNNGNASSKKLTHRGTGSDAGVE